MKFHFKILEFLTSIPSTSERDLCCPPPLLQPLPILHTIFPTIFSTSLNCSLQHEGNGERIFPNQKVKYVWVSLRIYIQRNFSKRALYTFFFSFTTADEAFQLNLPPSLDFCSWWRGLEPIVIEHPRTLQTPL